MGPFLKPNGHWAVDQWGMIPIDSRTRVPTSKQTSRRLSTNNARVETVATAWTYRFPWQHGQRCLIAADSFDEPYYPDNVKTSSGAFAEPMASHGRWQASAVSGPTLTPARCCRAIKHKAFFFGG